MVKYFGQIKIKIVSLGKFKFGVASMLGNKTVAVVVPAYNEEKQIRQVVETIPDFVDRIIIVNDCSTDKTAAIAAEYINKNNLPPAGGETDISSDAGK